MSKLAQEFKDFIVEGRERVNRERGRPYSNPISWQEVADETGIPVSNFYRWASGGGHPVTFETCDKLAGFFGEGVYRFLSEDIPYGLARLLANRHKPEVQRVIQQMEDAAAKNRDNGAVNTYARS